MPKYRVALTKRQLTYRTAVTEIEASSQDEAALLAFFDPALAWEEGRAMDDDGCDAEVSSEDGATISWRLREVTV